MAATSLGALPVAQRRRLVRRALVRPTLTITALVVLYYLLPLDHVLDAATISLLLGGVVTFICLIAWQVYVIMRSVHPVVQAIQALTTAIPLYLLLFAAAYHLMSHAQTSSFTEPLTRTDGLYFSVTVFSSVGFGDITPMTEAARVVVMFQMLGDLLVLGVVLRVVLGAVRLGRQRHEQGDPPDVR
jgi:voltage-gated potassium channel